MKKSILFVFITLCFLTSMLFGADIKKYDITGFSAVDVGWGMNVDIVQAEQYSVEVETDKKHFDYIKVEKDGNTLRVYISTKKNYRLNDQVNIRIAMPECEAISLHGGAKGNISMKTPDKPFDVELSGGARLKGNINCSDISLDLSGGSQVEFSGKAENLKVDGSGGAMMRLKDLSVKDVDAELSGGAMAYVTMNGKLNVSASGGSQVKYYGSATIGKMDFSGGAGVSQAD